MEENAYDVLLNYAKKSGLKYACNNVDYHFALIPSDPWANKKYIVIEKNDTYFLAYDSFGTRYGSSFTRSGIYKKIKLDRELDIEVHPKDWADFMIRRNKIKTDSSYVNKKLTVCSVRKNFPLYLFTKKVVDRFEKLSNQIKPLKLVIKHDEISMIQDLKDKTILGLETNKWIYQEQDLNLLLNKGVDLLEIMFPSERVVESW